MNTISANAPPARTCPRRIVARAARKLGDLIAPHAHAGKGNWNNDTDIPVWAWPAGIAFALFLSCGREFFAWLLRFAC